MPRPIPGKAESEAPRRLPDLPPGCEVHPIWSFRDQGDRISYEFNLVYGPSRSLDGRGPVRMLDEELSYWSATWMDPGGTAGPLPAGRWLSYGQARELRGRRLKFSRFSCLMEMRDELPDLLQVDAEVGGRGRDARA